MITSADADHLDIYGTEEPISKVFRTTPRSFNRAERSSHTAVCASPSVATGMRRYDYARTEGDFHAENIRIGGGAHCL